MGCYLLFSCKCSRELWWEDLRIDSNYDILSTYPEDKSSRFADISTDLVTFGMVVYARLRDYLPCERPPAYATGVVQG